MKIIRPSYEILPRDGQRGDMATIERAARVCYKSEDKICDGSAEQIVRRLIGSGHLSAIEHGAYAFEVSGKLLEIVSGSLRMIGEQLGDAPRITATCINSRCIVSGNCRAWRELTALASDFVAGAGIAVYFVPYIDKAYIGDLIDVTDCAIDDRVRPLTADELAEDSVSALYHLRQTVRFVVDRGVSHEFVRHRVMSFSQESTRFCRYSDDRLGNEITVIDPCFFARDDERYRLWKRQCMSAEAAYMQLIHMGAKPEEARDVLPTSVKTEMIVTGTLAQWGHFFELRARQTTGKAHPQAVEVALPLMQDMTDLFPAIGSIRW